LIKVSKNYQDPPAELLSKNCIIQIKEAIKEKNGAKYSTNYYRHNKVLKKLKEDIYHGKCAYCESKSEHAAALQVEHFRPKDGLEFEKNDDEKHKGYYWLGNEWSNLLLGCPKCNGKGGKGTRFPISGKRVYDSPIDGNVEIDRFDRTQFIAENSPLIDEKPLLLNPESQSESDDPKNHLEFDNLGQIKGITERGTATIDICDLNRDALCKKRQEVVNQFVNDIKWLVYALEKGKITIEGLKFLLEWEFEKILKCTKPEEEYALWGRFIFKEFEYCILSRINPAFRDAIREEFEKYCTGLPQEEKNF
jgi:uncharacterized protein (TIGR02646 family)